MTIRKGNSKCKGDVIFKNWKLKEAFEVMDKQEEQHRADVQLAGTLVNI